MDFDLALEHHQAGRLEEAEKLYQTILREQPGHILALHNLAVISLQREQYERALPQLRQVIASDPAYRPAYINEGHVLRALKRPAEAAASFRHATKLNAGEPSAWYFLGETNLSLGKIDQAEQALSRALELKPDWVEALRRKGSALFALGRDTEAVACLEQAIRLAPNDIAALNALALGLAGTGRHAEAAALFRQAIALVPHAPELYCNLGALEREHGNIADSLLILEQGALLAPGSALIQNNLGLALAAAGRFDDALAAYERSLHLSPRSASSLSNKAATLKRLGRLEEATAAFVEANAIDPHIGAAQIFSLRQMLCDWSHFAEDQARLNIALVQNAGEISPFSALSAIPAPEQQLACARDWASRRYPWNASPTPNRLENRRIRLGYLSGDFRRHAVAYLLIGLLERHDHGKFELFGYSYGPEDGSGLRQRIVTALDHFVDISPLNHSDAAQKIAGDGIDILVDLGGYTAGSRPQIPALRPAPLQLSFLGYPGSMGAHFIDGVIADPYLAPIGSELLYSEKVLRLPECYQPSDPARVPEQSNRAACGLPEDALVLCCFNNSFKINKPIFDAWTEILKAVPKAVLWLSMRDGTARDNIRREAKKRNIGENRLIFADIVPFERYLGQMALADLFLDCFPYNAGATANDALWVGLPLLTCSGRSYVSRMAGSLLNTLGIPELIATDLDDYVNRAIDLLSDPAKLNALRVRLNALRENTPLFDMTRYARNFEALLFDAWNDLTTQDYGRADSSQPLTQP